MGRGRSGAGGTTGGSSGRRKSLYDGVYVEGSAGAYQAEADEIVTGVRAVLDDFGMSDALGAVYFRKAGAGRKGSADAVAGMNGQGDLSISPEYLSSGNRDSKGYNVSDTFFGTGAHEAGHAVVYGLIKQVMPGSTRLEQSNARKSGKLEKRIIGEAIRRYGRNVKISGYGSESVIEKVAEAVSDVYSNGGKSNPFSVVIVGVMKDIKNGKFSPKI